MTRKNLFLVLGLSLAVGAGAGAGISAHFASTLEVKEARAADSWAVIGKITNSTGGQTISNWDHDYVLTLNDGVYSGDFYFNTDDQFKVRKDGKWDESYGTYGLVTFPTGAFEGLEGDNIKVKVAGHYTVKYADGKINIRNYGAAEPETRKFYLLQNSDWSDWASARIHFWGSNLETCGRNPQALTNLGRSYTANGVTGNLYSYDIPATTTGLQIYKSDKSKSTTDLAINASINAATLFWDDADKLDGFNLKIVANGAYLRGDWADGWNVDGQIPMASSSKSGPFTVTGVDLSAGSAVKAVYMENGVEIWSQFHAVSTNDEERYPVKTVDDGMSGKNAAVVSTGKYNITVSKYAEGQWDYAFEGTANTDLDDAVSFANGFVSAMYAECPYNYGTSSYNAGKDAASIAAAWSAKKTAYDALSTDVQYYLLQKDSKISAITAFFESYDYVYGHYSAVRALVGADFLDRDPPLAANGIPTALETRQASPAVMIAAVAGIGVLASVAAIFMMRKHSID